MVARPGSAYGGTRIVQLAGAGPHQPCRNIDDLHVTHSDSTLRGRLGHRGNAETNITLPVPCSTRQIGCSVTDRLSRSTIVVTKAGLFSPRSHGRAELPAGGACE